MCRLAQESVQEDRVLGLVWPENISFFTVTPCYTFPLSSKLFLETFNISFQLWTRLISAFQTEVTLKKTDEEGGQLFHNIREPPWQLVGRFCHGGFKLKILCKANSSQKLSLTQHSTSLLTYMRMIWIYVHTVAQLFRRIKRKIYFWLRSTANVVQGTARSSRIFGGI